MYGFEFKPDPEIALFGYSAFMSDHNVSVQSTIIYGMIITKSIYNFGNQILFLSSRPG